MYSVKLCRKMCEAYTAYFFSRQDELCFCKNVADLFEALGITCNPSEWRLFIDSSSRSFKPVLLHNRNNYLSLPMARSVHLKEDYTSVKMLLNALKYDDYGYRSSDIHSRISIVGHRKSIVSYDYCHRILQNGVVPYGPSRQFHEISLFPLP